MATGDIIKYNASLTQEERIERARIAGLASAEAKRNKKTLAELVQAWADCEVKDKSIVDQLKDLGIENPTNKATLILPLLSNVNEKGDTKSMQMLIELLCEDKKREAEIKKLEAEIEKLKKEVSGEISENTITIINNVPKVDENGEY